jgi:succinylarginine dihydrolase
MINAERTNLGFAFGDGEVIQTVVVHKDVVVVPIQRVVFREEAACRRRP